MVKIINYLMMTAFLAVSPGCASLKIKHEVAPIYATLDINIKIQRELEKVYDFEKSRENDSASGEEE